MITLGINEYAYAWQCVVLDMSATEVVMGPPRPEAAAGRGGGVEVEEEARYEEGRHVPTAVDSRYRLHFR